MRTLTTALKTAQQKRSLYPAVKITFSKSGETDVVVEDDKILSINHPEEPYRQSAEVLLDNSTGYFTDLDLKGWQAVISYGLVTKEVKEYSDCAPLTVRSQQLNSSPGKLTCELRMNGIPDMLAEDRASEAYVPKKDKDTGDYDPSSADTDTVKDLLTKIIEATMTCFSHCHAYQVVYDSEDSLIDSYKPRDGFRIYHNGSRLAALRRLIDFTHCMMRFGSDGKIHILKPTTTGSNYDYEYSLASGHTFFAKAYRKTLVIPNYIVVQSNKDDEPQYSGYAKDQDSIDAFREIRQFARTRLEGDGQGEDIAEAILGKYQLNAEMGAAEVPMNCGAELLDYVKVTDEKREGNYRVGNIGSITRKYKPGQYTMQFSFGGWLTVRGLSSNLEVYPDGVQQHIEELFVDELYATYIYTTMIDAEFLSAIAANMGLLTAGEIRIGTGVLEPSGYATWGSQTTLEDSGASWTPDEWIGENIRVVINQTAYTRQITGNTATVITFNALPAGVIVTPGVPYYMGRISVASGDSYWLEHVGSDTATGGSTTTLEDSGAGWETDEHKGSTLRIIKNGCWYERKVLSNTSDTLTFDELPLYEPFNGFRLWADGDLGRIAGFKDGLMQFYTGSDGKMYAAAGAVKLDYDGVTVSWGADETVARMKFIYDAIEKGYIIAGSYGFGIRNKNAAPICLIAHGEADVIVEHNTTGRALRPANTNYTNLGTSDKAWKGGYFDNRLKIPVGEDMYD